MDYDPIRRGFAEFVGTFALIFIGAGTIMTLDKLLLPATNGNAQAGGVYGALTLVSVALAHGLVIAVMASAVGHISGGHFNPAVTLGFLVTRRIAGGLAAVYWFAQITAAILAALLLRGLLPEAKVDAVNLGVPGLGPGISGGQGVVIEAILTFF